MGAGLSSCPSGHQDQLAEQVAAEHDPVRLGRLGQRQHAVDDRADPLLPEQRQAAGPELVDRLLGARLVGDRQAVNGQVLEDGVARVQLDPRPRAIAS
jgi:hypothetical protein